MPIIITTEPFNAPGDAAAGPQRRRPIKAEGRLSSHTVGRKAPPPVPLATQRPGFAGADVDGFDRGHLIAESLGGPNTSENIVPMQPTFNQAGGVWYRLEHRVDGLLDDWRYVNMTVEVQYAADSPLIPARFLVTVTVSDAADAGSSAYFGGNELNRFPITHEPVVPVQEMVDDPLIPVIRDAEEQMRAAGWRLETMFGPHAPRHPVAPVEGDIARPYAVLDYLWLHLKNGEVVRRLGPRVQPGPRTNFTQEQKQLIYLVNRMRNEGWLRSDYAGDMRVGLVSGVGGRRAAQVDHMVPSASGGANVFSNARIASGTFNMAVGRQAVSTKVAHVLP